MSYFQIKTPLPCSISNKAMNFSNTQLNFKATWTENTISNLSIFSLASIALGPGKSCDCFEALGKLIIVTGEVQYFQMAGNNKTWEANTWSCDQVLLTKCTTLYKYWGYPNRRVDPNRCELKSTFCVGMLRDADSELT